MQNLITKKGVNNLVNKLCELYLKFLKNRN